MMRDQEWKMEGPTKEKAAAEQGSETAATNLSSKFEFASRYRYCYRYVAVLKMTPTAGRLRQELQFR
jgi:hypothetical protein